jgi:hypothetical protein
MHRRVNPASSSPHVLICFITSRQAPNSELNHRVVGRLPEDFRCCDLFLVPAKPLLSHRNSQLATRDSHGKREIIL